MVYFWLRATLDWSDEAAFNAQLPGYFVDKVRLWNKTFNLPYHLFRHRVREIAACNHADIQGARFAEWEKIPSGGLVVPVDDDDWFAPDLPEQLANVVEPRVFGYYWTGSFLQVPIHWRHEIGLMRRRLWPGIAPVHLCMTNNYAIVKSGDDKKLAVSHLAATEAFRAALEMPTASNRVKKMAGRPSLMNRTLASQTTLGHKRKTISRTALMLRYRRYQRIYRKPLPDELAWSAPYQALMAELMDDLKVRQG
jgi:hypothetical protein